MNLLNAMPSAPEKRTNPTLAATSVTLDTRYVIEAAYRLALTCSFLVTVVDRGQSDLVPRPANSCAPTNHLMLFHVANIAIAEGVVVDVLVLS